MDINDFNPNESYGSKDYEKIDEFDFEKKEKGEFDDLPNTETYKVSRRHPK